MLFNKILIANRGEIACRIIKTAKRLGIKTVAVFSEADSNALHVKMADEAYLIGKAHSRDSYLNIDKIISVAMQARVEAIHPGYGFLSENAEFAKACEQSNIIFIGPNSKAIELMGNKNVAKEIMHSQGIPILPGYYGDDQSLFSHAKTLGFPIVLKAVAGGGGKGLRVVHDAEEFELALQAVKREAKSYFNDDKIMLEKYLSDTRHVEVQILGDHYTKVVHLLTRDCSIQRRHQKIIEEAPAPNISSQLQEKIGAAAVKVAKAINYTNAGTVEFLINGEDSFYFMEMNTRLQVEHPVTEMVTGIDIVEWQLRIAAEEHLFDEVFHAAKGYAIEVRLNAEDPDNDFKPTTGRLEYLQFPATSESLRIDCGYEQDDEINIYYDSLLAKIIAFGKDREDAIHKLSSALTAVKILGIKTNLFILRDILKNEDFIAAKINTQFLSKHLFISNNIIHNSIYAIGAIFLLLFRKELLRSEKDQDLYSPWKIHDGWQLYFTQKQSFHFQKQEELITLVVSDLQNNQYSAVVNEDNYNIRVLNFEKQKNIFYFELIIADKFHSVCIFKKATKLAMNVNDEYYEIEVFKNDSNHIHHEETNQLVAPMPGTIVAMMVNSGQRVHKGDKLLVIEAMKMEHTLYAPKDGVVKDCRYKIGDLINEGAELLEFE